MHSMTGAEFHAMDWVVGAAGVLSLAFTALWLASPRFRDRVEQPKHRFQERLRGVE